MSETSPTTSDSRICIRLRQVQKAMIEEAAVQLGQSLNEFATSVLLERSRDVIDRHHRTTLTDRDRDLFLEMLENDRPNDVLLRAAKMYKDAIDGCTSGEESSPLQGQKD